MYELRQCTLDTLNRFWKKTAKFDRRESQDHSYRILVKVYEGKLLRDYHLKPKHEGKRIPYAYPDAARPIKDTETEKVSEGGIIHLPCH
jgi:hypothetical protein